MSPGSPRPSGRPLSSGSPEATRPATSFPSPAVLLVLLDYPSFFPVTDCSPHFQLYQLLFQRLIRPDDLVYLLFRLRYYLDVSSEYLEHVSILYPLLFIAVIPVDWSIVDVDLYQPSIFDRQFRIVLDSDDATRRMVACPEQQTLRPAEAIVPAD